MGGSCAPLVMESSGVQISALASQVYQYVYLLSHNHLYSMSTHSPRLSESRQIISQSLRKALDSVPSEPNPPLTGAGTNILTTTQYIKPLLLDIEGNITVKNTNKALSLMEEVVVESLLLLARVMESAEIYSDTTLETPLTAACYFALGSYTEQETEKSDEWREKELTTLYQEAYTEYEIIVSSLREATNPQEVLDDAVDLVLLLTILYAALLTYEDITDHLV